MSRTMYTFLHGAVELLRGTPTEGGTRRSLPVLLAYLFLFGLFYGAVMGTFGFQFGDRWLQMVYSGLKVPLLLIVTFLLGLPSFYVANALLGLRDDFADSVRALIATQAGLAIVLASLAPLTFVWYLTSQHYEISVFFNALMFTVAAFAGQILLRRFYRPLIARNANHKWVLRLWIVIYSFVGIQMGWILRPFVGMPGAPVEFFRDDTWGNAYLIVGEKLLRLLLSGS